MDFFTGTSFATPYVAGVAAKIWAAHPNCSNKQIRQALQKSAQKLGTNPTPTRRFGYGLIRARAANKYIKEHMFWPCGHVPPPSPGPTQPPTREPTRHPTKAPTPGPTFSPQEGGSVNNPDDDSSSLNNAHCQVALTSCDGDFTTLGDLSSSFDTVVSAAGSSDVDISKATRSVRICCLGLSCQKLEGSKRGACVRAEQHHSSSAVASWWSSLAVPCGTAAALILFGMV
mmetsp:Transcript_25121/g.61942  ORF Transcript_25121/g.61942 Transcript_25121/m.61942 type:complete len:229 (+) Transcript_25121:1276-1962(+)